MRALTEQPDDRFPMRVCTDVRDRRGRSFRSEEGGENSRAWADAGASVERAVWSANGAVSHGSATSGAGEQMPISRQAFESHVLALLGPLEGVARRLTRNDADAEDLVAETVTRAWRALDSLESEAAFRSWIFRILNNTFVSELRRAGARPKLESIDCDEGADDEAEFSLFEQVHQPFLLWFSNPEQEFLNKLLREDLERALATLPEEYRIVVVLSDMEEFKYGEIAEMLGIPIGTVRSRLARARGALQKILWEQARDQGLKRAAAPGPGTSSRPPEGSDD
jgi:RNA polymerase sigma-70 factor (ECF subfamily)